MASTIVLGLAHFAVCMPSLASRREILAGSLGFAALPSPKAAYAVDEMPYIVDSSQSVAGSYKSISAAVAAAPAGGSVVVRAGTYNEQVFIDRPLTVMADAGTLIQWKSDRPYEAALTIDLSGSQSPGKVTVVGLGIRHSSPSIAQNYAVFVRGPAGREIELQKCDVSSGSGSGVGVEGGETILSDCSVHDCPNHGILYLGRGATGRIKGCVIEKCKLNGVLLRDGSSPTIEANVLRGNGQFGMSLIDCRGRILDNQIKSNGKGAVNGDCDPDDDL